MKNKYLNIIIMKTQIKKTAKDLGFVPKYKPMTEEQSRTFINVLTGEPKPDAEDILDGKDAPFPILILNKRIEVMKLPIKFTFKAKMIMLIFTEGNPGKVMTFLIDALQKFEGETVDEDKATELYPMGFYTDDSVMELVDTYIKTRKIAWSEIY